MNRSKLIIILSAAILCVVTVLCVMLVMIFPSLTENVNKLVFESESCESYYDGTALTGTKWSLVSGELKPGHTAQVTLSGSQRYVGTTPNLMQIVIVDSNGKDVTSRYNIECKPGTLTVKPANITIVSNSRAKIYDGQPLFDGGYMLLPEDALPSGHVLDVEITGKITEIGETANTISRVVVYDVGGKDISFNFNIIPVEGRLVVLDEDDPRLNLDINKDGMPDLNIDFDGDLIPDLNIDLNGDFLSDLNIDLNGDLLADLNIDLNGDMLSDLNIDLNGDRLSDLNIDLDGDKIPDLNIDLDGDKIPDVNIDGDGDKIPDLNIDIDGDKLPDVNVDIDGDGIPDINIDGLGNGNSNGNGNGNGGSGKLDISGNIGSGDLNGDGKKTVCYKVTSDSTDRIYLKVTNFGSYNGKQWSAAKQYDELIYGSFSASYLPSIAMLNSGRMPSNVYVEVLNEQAVVPYYSYGLLWSESDIAVSYQDENLEFVCFGGGHRGLTTPYDLYDYEERYRSFVYENYLDIDPDTFGYMQKIIEANGFSASSPGVIEAVAEYIQQSAKYDLKYDRSLDKEDNIVVKFLDEYKTGICQHYASAATLLYRALGIPARYTVGFVCDAVAGKTVEVTAMQAHAWVEVYIDGLGWIFVEVTGSDGSGDIQENPNKITVTPSSCEKRYDGQPLVAENEIQMTPAILNLINNGYTLVTVVSGERTDPGKSESFIADIRIYDPFGEDVTHEFQIERKTGVVHVYIGEFYFASETVSKEYDGTALEGDLSNLVYMGADFDATNYTYQATPSILANIKNVGSTQNSFNVKIFNENNEDVTDMYMIVKQWGSLEIEPRSITVTAGSATASYTGEPLVCNDIFVTSGILVEEEYIFDYVVEGSQTDRGRSDNIVKSITIYDANGNDVTQNYAIVFEKGTLRVTN